MDIIQVSKEDKKGIIEYYTIKIKELEGKIQSYKNLISKLDNTNTFSSGNLPVMTAPNDSIEENEEGDFTEVLPTPRQNWKYLSLNVLKSLDKFSTTNEIYDKILKDKPDFSQYDKADVISKISTALSNLYSKKNIKRIKNTLGRGYFWALLTWYDGDVPNSVYKQQLLNEYGVDESALFGEIINSTEIREEDLPF